MKVGDLVKLDPEAYWEEADEIGDRYPADPNALGLILDVLEPATSPFCVEVWWPNGRTQRLYSDELLPVRKPRKPKNSGAASFKNNSDKKSKRARSTR